MVRWRMTRRFDPCSLLPPREGQTCLRCGYTWYPKWGSRAKACARCRSHLWNRPRIRSCGGRPRRDWDCPRRRRSLPWSNYGELVAFRFTRLRNTMGVTNGYIAALFDVSERAFKYWVSGERRPRYRNWRILAVLERRYGLV